MSAYFKSFHVSFKVNRLTDGTHSQSIDELNDQASLYRLPPPPWTKSVPLSVQFRFRPITFYWVCHWHTLFGKWVHHHEIMCRVHSWSWYNIDLSTQGQIYRVNYMALGSGHNIFILCQSHTMFGMSVSVWYYLSQTFLTSVCPWFQYKKNPSIWVAQDRFCTLTQAYQILVYGCFTMRHHVVYIQNLCMTLIFDLYVGGGGILRYSQFLSCKVWGNTRRLMWCALIHLDPFKTIVK